MRETDWEALGDVQFILYNRVANQLNEALSGIALSDMPEASEQPPGYWKERATARVLNVLNMFTAWTWLIRYKVGEPIPERAIRPFCTNDLLSWVGNQLQFSPVPVTTLNPLLRANQETLQEALLLLYSVAYTQGSGVRLVCEAATLGTWFRIRFDRYKPLPDSIDALLTSFGDHWRAQDSLFELTTARDFVRLNGCDLRLISSAEYGEFAFFVPATVGNRRAELSGAQPVAQQAPDSVPPSADAPQVNTVSAQSASDTPLFKEPTSPSNEAVPPTLAVLRPLPPHLMRAALPSFGDLDGKALPADPDELKQTAGESASPSAPNDAAAGKPVVFPSPDTPLVSGPPPRPAAVPPAPVIVRARIPDPKLPEHLRTPPASTSNVALTRDTQTLTPLQQEETLAAADPEADQSSAVPPDVR